MTNPSQNAANFEVKQPSPIAQSIVGHNRKSDDKKSSEIIEASGATTSRLAE